MPEVEVRYRHTNTGELYGVLVRYGARAYYIVPPGLASDALSDATRWRITPWSRVGQMNELVDTLEEAVDLCREKLQAMQYLDETAPPPRLASTSQQKVGEKRRRRRKGLQMSLEDVT